MRVPQQPDGEYLSVVGSFGPGSAYPDTGADLRDRVYAARNVHPLRDSETAGVTSTWTEDQRQLVLDKWRITEKADWSNLVGYPTLTVTSIDPAVGDTAGGTAVTITGTGFGAGATVTIGGSAATNIVVVSSTEITCDTPAGTGQGDVVVTVDGESVTLAEAFAYQTYPPWDVTALPSDVTASNSDYTLTRAGGGNSTRIVSNEIDKASGKYALRFLVSRANPSKAPAVGVRHGTSGSYLGGNSSGWGCWGDSSVGKEYAYHNGVHTDLGNLAAFSPAVELMIEIDIDNGEIWFGVDGTWVGDPAEGTGATYTNLSGTLELVADMYYEGEVTMLNPDQFTTPATSGFTPGWPT